MALYHTYAVDAIDYDRVYAISAASKLYRAANCNVNKEIVSKDKDEQILLETARFTTANVLTNRCLTAIDLWRRPA
jgi:hypothetical protein